MAHRAIERASKDETKAQAIHPSRPSQERRHLRMTEKNFGRFTLRYFKAYLETVIARSSCDEAIQLLSSRLYKSWIASLRSE